MSGYIKCFDSGGKNMSFMIKIKKTLNIKFYSMSVYDEKYMNVKVQEFNAVVNAVFSNDIVPKEGAHHSLYRHRSCYENGKKKLSSSVFRRMQV